MCRITATKHTHHPSDDDDDDGCWTEGLQPFSYYARHRTAEQRRRLWAMVGGRDDEWNEEER